jgi:hypothetical protein
MRSKEKGTAALFDALAAPFTLGRSDGKHHVQGLCIFCEIINGRDGV